MGDADADLLLRAAAGDLDAFRAFVGRFETRIRGVLRRLLDDDRDVEEAAQDVFVQAWRNLHRFRGDAAPFTWLYRIAVNEALQRTRRRRLETVPIEDAPPGDAALRTSDRSGPVASAEAAETRAFLAARLRALPAEYRAAVVLRDVEGLSQPEVAEVLGVSLAAAKSRIHRGRMQLREDLAAWLGPGQGTPPRTAAEAPDP